MFWKMVTNAVFMLGKTGSHGGMNSELLELIV